MLAWPARVPGMARVAALVGVALLASCGGGGGGSGGVIPPGNGGGGGPGPAGLTRLSTDPFSNAGSQHATEVEPDAVAAGPKIVATFQQGRFDDSGSSDIGFATSANGGLTWTPGSLPDLTLYSGGTFGAVSDPSVAYDPAHGVWLIASLPITAEKVSSIYVSRSADGVSWNLPVTISLGLASADKEWIACDATSSSPFYGHCYLEWDDPSANGIIHMSTSTDGGMTWGPIRNTADSAVGIGGEPVIQPNGTVIVPIDDYIESSIHAFATHDGGSTWSSSVLVSAIIDHFDAGGIRSPAFPSVALDSAGTVYLVWQDCRFRINCDANDIVLTTSSNGTSWTAPVRIPIDSANSGIDHFIPGLAADPTTSGGGTHLALSFYSYANSSCTQATCQLNVEFTSSQDGGASWSTPATVAGPMSLGWLPQTLGGTMVGDYITGVYSMGHPVGIFAVAQVPAGAFNEAMYAFNPAGSLTTASVSYNRVMHEQPIPGAHSDHPPRPRLPPVKD